MSKLYFTPFQPLHIRRLVDIQDEQAEDMVFAMSMEEASILAKHRAWSGWIGSDVIGCAGFCPIWKGRSFVWALIGNRCGSYMPQITKFVKRQLDEHPDARIEATVLTGFVPGKRWVNMLGFELETPGGMEHYSPEGRNMSLYSLVRHDRA